MAVDERSEVVFFYCSRDVAVATNFVGKIDLQSTHLTRVCVRHEISAYGEKCIHRPINRSVVLIGL